MLVGKNVVLRTIREADLEELYDLAADVRDVGDYWQPAIISEIRWKKRISEDGWWEADHGGLLIADRHERTVGQILFFKPSAYQNSYELGYRIYKPEDWGRGYMSEAVTLLVAYLFDTRPVDRIQATTIVGNEASRRVLEKCGFQFEGVLRRAIFHRGRTRDLNLFAILRGEASALNQVLDRSPATGT
jgi:ribosomal-protein-alanine N-acetyltransferase